MKMGKHKHQNKKLRSDIKSKYNFYFGIPHCHTSYSTGKGEPNEAFKYAKDKGLDFLIVTDHNSQLSGTTSYKKDTITKWEALKKAVSKFNKKHRSFCAMAGFEERISSIGEINIINSSELQKGSIRKYRKLYDFMSGERNCSVSINHPGSSILKLPYNEELNGYISCIEVGNGSPPFKYKRYDRTYLSLLDKGWKLGAINGQDNHQANWGERDNLTAVLAEKRNSKSIIEAFKRRRTYSTESRTLRLSLSINNVLMGGEVKSSSFEDVLSVHIFAEDKFSKINKIQLLTNGANVLWEEEALSDVNTISFQIKALKEQTWYLIRVFQEGERLAISSPVFIV
jgi:hypothetical protein